MSDHIDGQAIDLAALQARLNTTDLIPSQEPLRDGMARKMSALGAAGVNTLADLQANLKTAKGLASLAERTGIDPGYLQLLRRTINGFFPKPRALREIDWLDAKTVVSLAKAGIGNTQQLYDAASQGAASLARKTGTDVKTLRAFLAIADLCRIQWVSPTFARVLVAAGMSDPADVARADPEALFQAIADANAGAKFYKGKIGLRDIRRLVTAAAYVP